jgi:hypothetical protein
MRSSLMVADISRYVGPPVQLAARAITSRIPPAPNELVNVRLNHPALLAPVGFSLIRLCRQIVQELEKCR